MFNWFALFSSALLYGLGLSLVLVIIMVISSAIAADMWVGDYPADIRQKYGPMSERAARWRPYIAAAVFGAALLIPILGLSTMGRQLGHVPFLTALAFGMVTLLVFNIFDLLILDWLFFCTIQPRAMVLPGTAGMAGYRDYRFHFMGFLKGLGFSVIGGLVIAGIWTMLQAILQ